MKKNIPMLIMAVLLVVSAGVGMMIWLTKNEVEKSYSQQGEKLREAERERRAIREAFDALRREVQVGSGAAHKEVGEVKTLRIEALENKLQDSRHVIAGLEEEVRQKNSELSSLSDQSGKTRALLLEKESVIKIGRIEVEKLKEEGGAISEMAAELKTAYDELVREFRQEIANRDTVIKEYEKKLSITFMDRVIFDSAEVSITMEGKKTLDKVAAVLKKIKGGKIRIGGHTDNVPIRERYREKFPTNWELSAARAAAVVRFFQFEAGVSPEKMEISGHSFYKPVSGNDTKAGRAANRRVEITVTPAIEHAVF